MPLRRRRIITAIALVPAALLVLLETGSRWGSMQPFAHVAQALVTLVVFGALVYVALGGLAVRRAGAALFVLGWGGLVLAFAVGATAGSAVHNEMARGGEHPLPDSSGGAVDDTGSPAPPSRQDAISIHSIQVREEDPSRTPRSLVPDGTAQTALLLGWLVAGAASVAYVRTGPRQDAAGSDTAGPPDGPDGPAPTDSGGPDPADDDGAADPADGEERDGGGA